MKIFISFFTLLFAANVSAQTNAAQNEAEIIVEKYIEAAGGAGAFKAVQSVIKEGTQNYYGIVEALKITYEKNKLLRYDIEYNGQQGYWMVSQKEAGEYFPWENRTIVNHKEAIVKSLQNNLQYHDPLMNYKIDSSTVRVMGKDTINKRICSKIRLTTKKGNPLHAYWIDDETFMVARMEKYYILLNKSNDKLKALDRFDYSDYRQVGTIMLPFAEKFKTVINKAIVGTKESLFYKIEINQPINPTLYHGRKDIEVSSINTLEQ